MLDVTWLWTVVLVCSPDPEGGVAKNDVQLPNDKGPGKDSGSDGDDGRDGMSRRGRQVRRERKGCG